GGVAHAGRTFGGGSAMRRRIHARARAAGSAAGGPALGGPDRTGPAVGRWVAAGSGPAAGAAVHAELARRAGEGPARDAGAPAGAPVVELSARHLPGAVIAVGAAVAAAHGIEHRQTDARLDDAGARGGAGGAAPRLVQIADQTRPTGGRLVAARLGVDRTAGIGGR